jgi:hypothetical protein
MQRAVLVQNKKIREGILAPRPASGFLERFVVLLEPVDPLDDPVQRVRIPNFSRPDRSRSL